jgi:hypothetical protein
MSHDLIDRPENFLGQEADLAVSASVSDDDDAPQLDELLFDIGVAVAAYLTLGFVLDLLVLALHL